MKFFDDLPRSPVDILFHEKSYFHGNFAKCFCLKNQPKSKNFVKIETKYLTSICVNPIYKFLCFLVKHKRSK